VLARDEATGDAIARRLIAKGRDREAVALDRWLVEFMSPAVGSRVRLTERAIASGNVVEARALALDLVRRVPASPQGHSLLARVTTDDLEAERTLERGLEATGESSLLLRDLVLRRGQRLGLPAVDKELVRLRAALAAEGQSLAIAFAAAAQVENVQHHDREAARLLMEAARIDPEGPYARSSALVAEQALDWPAAAAAWQKVLDRDPANGEARAGHARARAEWARIREEAARP
jgi:hypothetical protein